MRSDECELFFVYAAERIQKSKNAVGCNRCVSLTRLVRTFNAKKTKPVRMLKFYDNEKLKSAYLLTLNFVVARRSPHQKLQVDGDVGFFFALICCFPSCTWFTQVTMIVIKYLLPAGWLSYC